MRNGIIVFVATLAPLIARAHDTWVETNTSIVRTGDVVHVDLKLGNHGNEHRDFKLASKISLDKCQLSVIGPDGKAVDLKHALVDTGYAPKEGYWTGRFVTTTPGLHTVSHTLDTLHGTTRAIKSGKTHFMASNLLDNVSSTDTSYKQPLGHPLELVLLKNPTELGAAVPIRVKLLYQSKPLANVRVTFVPRGAVLSEGIDKDHEQNTDADGIASYTPDEGNVILIVVHHASAEQKGEGYDKTHYTATLTVAVPQLCPHCVKRLISSPSVQKQ